MKKGDHDPAGVFMFTQNAHGVDRIRRCAKETMPRESGSRSAKITLTTRTQLAHQQSPMRLHSFSF